jgi:hypothetical protein
MDSENICEWCGEDEFDCYCGTDYCCYDPRYTGPKDYCACKEHAENEYNELSVKEKFNIWISNKKYNVMIFVKSFFKKKGMQ